MRACCTILIGLLLWGCGAADTPTKKTPTTTACTTGNTKCSGDLLQTCVSGAWNSGTSCSPNTCLTVSSTLAECSSSTGCTTGNTRCSNGLLQTCVAGAWDAGTNCSRGTCVSVSSTEAECQSTTTCTNGNTKCSGNLLQTCVSGAWNTGTTCSPNTCVTVSTTLAECQSTTCTNGNTRCSSNNLQTCVANAWNAGTTCSPNTCVTVSSTLAECQAITCTNGNTRCSSNLLQTCVTNAWNAGTSCSPDTCVTVSATLAECQSSGAVCTESSGTYYVCDDTMIVECTGTAGAEFYDCADDSGDCYDYGGTFGGDCVMPLGANCVVCLDSECADWYVDGCGVGTPNPNYACDIYDGCTALSHGCTPADPFTAYCDGEFYVYACADYENVDFPVGYDCADIGGWCENYGGTFGVDCIVPLGGGCVTCVDAECTSWYPLACGASGSFRSDYACSINTGCKDITSACTPSTSFAAYCDGNFLVTDCVDYVNFDVPIGLDCADTDTFAGTCNAGGYCVVGANKACETGADSLLRCPTNYSCINQGGSYVCVQN